MSSHEQRFMAVVDAVDVAGSNVQPVQGQMQNWLAALEQALDAARLRSTGLLPDSVLAQQAEAINCGTDDGRINWAEQWLALQPAQWLAQNFEDKVMLLVFGKFNAGKSSLCNFLAQRFHAQGHRVQYFHLEGGAIRATEECFREGATETTARLQGVCLGEKLVLLDTPGLHSATDENALLTQRFLDSADAVLWLTSSTSPGQVQELDELARELHRGKPLLPIVTRSDYIEEDEVDGVIVTCLRNKSVANRALQEADVLARATDKLRMLQVDPKQLKAAVSVSAHVVRAQEHSDAAMAEAGFEHLYAALLDIVAPTLAYKQRKPAEMLLHHLEEQVLAGLHTRTLPALAELTRTLQAERDALEERQTRMVQMAWREVIPDLPARLEQHAPQGDVKTLCTELVLMTVAAFERQAQAQLNGYLLPAVPVVEMVLPAGVTYEVAPPADIDEGYATIGYERLYSVLSHAVHELLAGFSAQAVTACGQTLQELTDQVQRLHDTVLSHERALLDLKRVLHSGDKRSSA